MPLATLDDLFHNTLRDMYYAEKKLLKALPKMAKAATNEELAAGLKELRASVERVAESLLAEKLWNDILDGNRMLGVITYPEYLAGGLAP